MKTIDMPKLELSGSPRTRGRIHGETLRDEIAAVVEYWRASLGTYRGASRSETQENYVSEFLGETNFLSMIKAYTPDLLDEVRGIAEGARQSFNDILAMQLIDEEWTFGLRRSISRPRNKCTGFGVAVAENDATIAGQNMDIMSWADGYQALLKIDGDGRHPDQMVVTYAGLIALMGCNSSPLGVTCNTLSDLRASTSGLPVAFIVRRLLQQSTVDEAIEFLKTVSHASGQNYILSEPTKVHCFECSAGGAVELLPEKTGLIFHTNHQLVNNDIDPILQVQFPHGRPKESSEARLRSISQRLDLAGQRVSLQTVKAALSAHDDDVYPVSRARSQADTDTHIGFTAASVIFEFGVPFRMHLAAGPPCETEFQSFGFVSR